MPKHDIEDVRNELLALRRSTPPVSWPQLALRYGVNRGLLWRIVRKGHEPKDPVIRQRLGLTALIPTLPCPQCGKVHTKAHPKQPRRRDLFDYPVAELLEMIENREERR